MITVRCALGWATGPLAALVLVTAVPPASATAAPGRRSGTACVSGLGAARGASQVITVDAPSADSTTATLEYFARHGQCDERVGGPWLASVGRNGLSAHHHEGDGTTPLGTFTIGPVMYGIDPNPGVAYRYHRLSCGDWWDEDPRSGAYNRFVHVGCGARPPFGGASEALWTEAPAYDHFAVIDYNTAPVIAGRGSAIFLHQSTGGPTDGCVSLPAADLDALLSWLRPGADPVIVIRLGK